ncbi:MAG: hypothetical protein AAGD10_15900 [Myxococcota bacterium]
MRSLFFAAALALSIGAGGIASAQAPRGTETATTPPIGFVPIKGKNRAAKTPAGPLVVGAYAAVLAGLFLYVIYVQRSQGDIARRIEELRRGRDP